MRRYPDEVVEVHQVAERPAQFRWRDRLYLIRDVLAHWSHAVPWWNGAAAGNLLAGGAEPAGAGGLGLVAGEREFWRVEAAPGRAAAGVFDLCFDWSRGQWLLTRVLD